MITAYDTKLAAALSKLRTNSKLAPYFAEMEANGLTVSILPSPPTSENSQTYVYNRPVYTCFINTKGDAAVAWRKWKITLTTEENSIAHELGHVYFDYLLNIKKKPDLLKGGPSKLTPDEWAGIMSETMSRRFDLYSRPSGTIIPSYEPPVEAEPIIPFWR